MLMAHEQLCGTKPHPDLVGFQMGQNTECVNFHPKIKINSQLGFGSQCEDCYWQHTSDNLAQKLYHTDFNSEIQLIHPASLQR